MSGPLRCASCGLVNLPDAAACRRCGASTSVPKFAASAGPAAPLAAPSLPSGPAAAAYRAAPQPASSPATVRETCSRCSLVQVTRGPACSRCGSPLLAAQWDLCAPLHPAMIAMERSLVHSSLGVVAFSGAIVAFVLLVLISVVASATSRALMTPAVGVLIGASFIPFRLARLFRWRGGVPHDSSRAPIVSPARGRVAAGVVKAYVEVGPSLLVVTDDAIVAVPLGIRAAALASMAGVARIAARLDEIQRETLAALDALSDEELARKGRAYPRASLTSIDLEVGYKPSVAFATGDRAASKLRFYAVGDFVRARTVLAERFPGIVAMR